ncbi:MAG: hypothetical protein IKR57_01105 [Bacilli bacterium]|nr:hypothetical protein [Bacilli bacterium]
MKDIDYDFLDDNDKSEMLQIDNLIEKFYCCINYRDIYNLYSAKVYYDLIITRLNQIKELSKYDKKLKTIKNRLAAEVFLYGFHFDDSLTDEDVLKIKYSTLLSNAYSEIDKDLELAKKYYEMGESYFDSFKPSAVELENLKQLKIVIDNKEKSNNMISLISQIEKSIIKKDSLLARKYYDELVSLNPGNALQDKIIDLSNRIDEIEENRKKKEEETKVFNDQKEAYEFEIDRIKQLIGRNDKEIDNLEIDIHNLRITTFENKLELRCAVTGFSTVIPVFVLGLTKTFITSMSLQTFGLILGGSLLGTNLLLSRRFNKNKKLLKEKFNISKEDEIQEKKLELEIKKHVLEERKEVYKQILNNLEEEYDVLCQNGIPYDFEHKLNNEEEMNTNNIRSTRIIKNSIYSLEAEFEKILRDFDKINETNAAIDIDANKKSIFDFGSLFEYTFAPFMYCALLILMAQFFDYQPSLGMILGTVGFSGLLGSLKIYAIKRRLKAIKKKLEELKIIKPKYKEVYEMKQYEKTKTCFNECLNIEKQLIIENSELKYSERKKKEFEECHKELYIPEMTEIIEQTNGQVMTLEMK